jgi:endonuclease/exonuclease/phosphatase family metal-dependent hydrolase
MLRRRLPAMLVLLVSFAGLDVPQNSVMGTATAADSAQPESAAKDRSDEVIRGLPAAKTATKPHSVEVSVASYNVQARPLLDHPEEKFPQMSPLLNAYDVVLIQECFVRHELLWASADFPNKVYFGRPARGKGINSGLSVLTRLPMGETANEHYRDAGELQDRIASKGILLVRLQVGGMPLDVYDTHMEAGNSPPAQQARRKQAEQVVEFVKKNSPSNHALILMGDFNMGPLRPGKPWQEYAPNHYVSEEDMQGRTSAFEIMRKGLALQDAADVLHEKKVQKDADDGIERLLYRDGTQVHVEPLSCAFDNERFRRPDGSRLSDGSPLVARIRLTPVGGK